MMAESGCPFCSIVRREIPDTREVYRDDVVVAFFPIDPVTLGHTLVIPRKHIHDIWSLDDATAAHLARVTLRVAEVVRRAVHPEGLNVIQSNGKAATQTVPHLHVHVVPRWPDDGFGPIWPAKVHYSAAQKDTVLGQLHKELDRFGMA